MLNHIFPAAFLLALVAPAASQYTPYSGEPPVASKIQADLFTYYSTLQEQPSVATIYAQVTAAVGGPAAVSDLVASQVSFLSAIVTEDLPASQREAALTAWETVLPTSLRDVWDALQSSVVSAEASIIMSDEEIYYTSEFVMSSSATASSVIAVSTTPMVTSTTLMVTSAMSMPSSTAAPLTMSSVTTPMVSSTTTSLTLYTGLAAPTNGPHVWGVAGGILGIAGLVAAVL